MNGKIIKTLSYILHKSIFLYLPIIFLLTACEATDNTASEDSAATAVLSYGNSISQEISDTGSPTSSNSSSETNLPDFNSITPSEAAPSEIAPSEAASRLSSSPNSESMSELSELQVHYIDVGQGDSTLIICGNESLLIDAGDNSKGTAIQLYLQRQGIEELTYVIGTHPDSDHIGGLDVIITKFDCGMIIMPDVVSDTATYRDVIDSLKYRNYKITFPQPGNTYSLGDSEFTIIAPDSEYTNDNNSSVGIRLVHGNNSFLFTGDAEAEAETNILQNGIDVKADVLHTGHHGSATSSNQDFISRVSPTYAVISCGKDNPYGHPHEQTLNILKQQNVQIFRTDEQGSIVAISDGKSITWNTEPSQTWNAGIKASPDILSSSDERSIAALAIQPKPGVTVPEDNAIAYVLNHNTNKFHYPSCSSVKTIKESNREDTTMSREEIIAAGFFPCKICSP